MSAGDDLPPLPADAPRAGRYRHYKGNEYEVLDCALHSETLEWVVVYHPAGRPQPLWVRPLDMFAETVTVGGVTVPRFAPLASSRTSALQHQDHQAESANHGEPRAQPVSETA